MEALLALYRGATSVEHRHLTPAGLGVRPVGHFGFFRDGGPGTLWAYTVSWLTQA